MLAKPHAGQKKAIAQVLGCPWQRCSVHSLREVLGHARREQQRSSAPPRRLLTDDSGEQAG